MNTKDRRMFTRYQMPAMYTPVTVRTLDQNDTLFEGHAYDVSQGGVQFELDEPIPAGSPIVMQVIIPSHAEHAQGIDHTGPHGSIEPKERSVFAWGNVVWVSQDPDEPGPVRMAAVFTRFARPGDEHRLRKHIEGGSFSAAA